MRTELFPQYLETFNLFGGEPKFLNGFCFCFLQLDSTVALHFCNMLIAVGLRNRLRHLPQPDRSIQDHATDGQRRSFWLRKMTV